MARVKVTARFKDMQNNMIWREIGDEIVCDLARATQIANAKFGIIIDEQVEKKTPIEKAIKEEKKEKAVKEKATKEVKPEKKAIKKNAKK